MKKLILLLFLLIVISGCTDVEETTAEDGASIERVLENIPVETEIKVSQRDMEMVISPSQDRTIKDIVTLTATKVPPETGIVAFGIIGPDIEPLEETGPNLGYDNEGNDGWSLEFDTNSYPNNEYTIAAIAFPANRQSGEPPLGAAQARVEIKNSELSPVQPPAATPPYKVIGGSCQEPLNSIELAKRLNANTLAVGVFAGFMDNNGAAIWEPPEKAAKGCAKLITLAHENSMKTVFSVGLANEEDTVIEDFHFNRERFIQTYKEMMKSYAAFAQENKVSIFSIASEIDTLANIPTLQPEEKGSLTEELSKELIKGVKEVYDGKIAIGLAGVEYDEPEAPYYPFEGASIICFSAPESREDQIEVSLQRTRMLAALMKKTGQMAGGIQEVVLCEVYFFPKDTEVKFGVLPLNAAMEKLMEGQSSFERASFQEQEKEFYRRLISEVGPELSGIAISSGPPHPLSVRGRLAENTIAEEFERWK